MRGKSNISKIPWLFLIFFLLLTFLLLVSGHIYYKKEKDHVKSDQNEMLSAVATFKIKEITKWFYERKAEGVFISTSPACLKLFYNLMNNRGDSLSRREIFKWLMPIKKNHEYLEIAIFDMVGTEIFRISDPGWRYTREDGEEYLKRSSQGKIVFSELLRDKSTGNPFLSMLVPIYFNNRQSGIVVFRIDPAIYLFPIVASWPFERVTASSCLARLVNDQMIYLYIPNEQIEDISALRRDSVVDGLVQIIPHTNISTLVETTDFRGVNVFANYLDIPGTDWILVSKIDQHEIYAPLKAQAIKVILYLVTILVVMVIMGILLWKNQQLQYYRSQFELQSKNAMAEEKVRFMDALLQEVNDAIITFDKDMMIMSWNRGAERIYGWKAEEVIGKFGGGSLRVDFHGASRELVLRELDEKGTWKGEVIHKRKDGTNAYVLSSTSRLLDEKGHILGIITINKDISELVHSEKIKNAVYSISELAHSAKDLNDMYASFHVVIGELLDAPNLLIALLENSRETITYPYFVDEKESSPGPHTKGNGLIEYVLRTGRPLLAKPEEVKYLVDREIIGNVTDGGTDWLGIPLRIENETIGVLVVRSYSTKTRFGEREKDILTFVSEQIALSIHRKKMQQDLIEAMQRAEVSSRLTSALLANMNHELRTPMNGILGFAEILLNELEDPVNKSKAENILISGRRLMETLDAIMDLSYLESDKITRKFKPVSVGKTIRSVLRTYDQNIERKSLELNCRVAAGLTIMGDDHLFQHLVRNVIDNAIKYTDKGSITIEGKPVSMVGKAMASISVKDTGIGISPENHQMIFHAFRQVSEGYGRQFEGRGLGLTIGRKIVDLMGGEIILNSKVGEGSEFIILLPAVTETVVQDPLDVEELLKPKMHKELAEQMPDVLLVEDNTVNLQLLMVYLKEYCNIYSSLDGKSAIQMAQDHKFDAILMDINLGPGMDGIQAMLEIRKRPGYLDTPVIAVTGYASIGDRDRLISTGFTEYLPKPFTREKIASLMEGIFTRK